MGTSKGYTHMAELLDFAPITPSDSYPVVKADAPLFDEDGREVNSLVDHDGRRIFISPRIPWARQTREIAYAISVARQTYPTRGLRGVPYLGDVG